METYLLIATTFFALNLLMWTTGYGSERGFLSVVAGAALWPVEAAAGLFIIAYFIFKRARPRVRVFESGDNLIVQFEGDVTNPGHPVEGMGGNEFLSGHGGGSR